MLDLEVIERRHGEFTISTDHGRLDYDAIHGALSEHAYWAQGRSRETIVESWKNTALVCEAYASDGTTAGFARMVTDAATFGWLCDVWVDPSHRGSGLGVAIVAAVVEHPAVATIKRQLLATADAHELYRRFGYETMTEPERWMHRTVTKGV